MFGSLIPIWNAKQGARDRETRLTLNSLRRRSSSRVVDFGDNAVAREEMELPLGRRAAKPMMDLQATASCPICGRAFRRDRIHLHADECARRAFAGTETQPSRPSPVVPAAPAPVSTSRPSLATTRLPVVARKVSLAHLLSYSARNSPFETSRSYLCMSVSRLFAPHAQSRPGRLTALSFAMGCSSIAK